MSGAKHTPDSWILRTWDNGSWEIVAVDGMVIASRNSYEDRAVEMAANAHLIAAAPDLLAVVQSAIRCHESHQMYDKWSLHAARAAVAKAGGE